MFDIRRGTEVVRDATMSSRGPSREEPWATRLGMLTRSPVGSGKRRNSQREHFRMAGRAGCHSGRHKKSPAKCNICGLVHGFECPSKRQNLYGEGQHSWQSTLPGPERSSHKPFVSKSTNRGQGYGFASRRIVDVSSSVRGPSGQKPWFGCWPFPVVTRVRRHRPGSVNDPLAVGSSPFPKAQIHR